MAKKKIYTVATAHLDTIWSWDFETTVREYIYNTLVDNFKLFKKYPTYTFSFEGTYRYELMQEYYPELFEELKKYVASGRWNVCGSSYENGDMNVPSAEALFRNILFGNQYFDKTFGKRSVDIYLPDCFGFGWTLPSIAHHAHLMGFTTQKLAWGCAYGIPFDLGKWKGVDGEEIYASVNPHDYYFNLTKLRDWDFVQKKFEENEKYDLDWTYIFHGIGDRGGAPSEKTVEYVENEINKNNHSSTEVIAASADEIYHDMDEKLTDEQKAKLPVWDTELVMQNHGVGGYTSRAIGKRWMRRCQELADVAERGSVMSSYLGCNEYNQESLERSWKRFIAHQFHDDLPGTSVQRAYKRTWNDYAMSMNQFTNEIEASVGSMTQLMKTDFCEDFAIMVYNPMEVNRHEVVKTQIKHLNGNNVKITDASGKEVKSQIVKVRKGIADILFVADVPSLGCKVYSVEIVKTPCKLDSELSVTKSSLENNKYKVSLNDNGDINSIYDKELNKEILKKPVTLNLFNYTGSKDWPAWEMNYKEANKVGDRIPVLDSIEIVENGPVRVSLKVTQKDDRSEFCNIISLSDGGKVVEIRSEIEWQSLKTMCKHEFALNVSNEKATFDLGLGAIKRGNMNEKLFEVPAQNWADITDKNGEFGVSIISECKYGWDKFNDNTLRLTVLHTPEKNYRIDSMQSFMDLGLNRYEFAIYSHEGVVGESTQTQSRKYITPMTTYLCDKHDGILGTEYSFGNVSDNSVIIRAIKKAEDSDEIVVRLNEGSNKEIKDFKLSLGKGIKSAREIWASEEEKSEAVVKAGKLVTSFKPYEIKSFALTLKPSKETGRKVDCKPIDLPYTKNIISKQGEINTDFEYTIPYEIIPNTITSNGIKFEINKDSNNAVVCKGQKIEIKNADKIAFLCTSLKDDENAEFKINNDTALKRVYSCFERFARWDLYDFKETAYIKTGKLAYEATHCHVTGEDAIAKGMYFYLVEMYLNEDSTITLPDNENIIIIAGSAFNKVKSKLITPTYDKVEYKRPFTFKMNAKEKLDYAKNKTLPRLNDKDDFLTGNNRGLDY